MVNPDLLKRLSDALGPERSLALVAWWTTEMSFSTAEIETLMLGIVNRSPEDLETAIRFFDSLVTANPNEIVEAGIKWLETTFNGFDMKVN